MSDKPMMRTNISVGCDLGLWFRTEIDPSDEMETPAALLRMLETWMDHPGVARRYAIRLAAALSQPVERERCDGCGCLGVVQLGWHKDTGLDGGRLRCRLPRDHPGPCQPERRSGERRVGERRIIQPIYGGGRRWSEKHDPDAPRLHDRRSGKDRRTER